MLGQSRLLKTPLLLGPIRQGGQNRVGLGHLTLQHKQGELFAHRLAVRRLGGDGDIERLTRQHQRLARRDGGREAFAGEKSVVHGLHILAINRHGEAQVRTGLAA